MFAALVEGSRSLNGEVVGKSRTITGDAGPANLRQPFDQLVSGDGVRLCVTSIGHTDYASGLPSGKGGASR